MGPEELAACMLLDAGMQATRYGIDPEVAGEDILGVNSIQVAAKVRESTLRGWGRIAGSDYRDVNLIILETAIVGLSVVVSRSAASIRGKHPARLCETGACHIPVEQRLFISIAFLYELPELVREHARIVSASG